MVRKLTILAILLFGICLNTQAQEPTDITYTGIDINSKQNISVMKNLTSMPMPLGRRCGLQKMEQHISLQEVFPETEAGVPHRLRWDQRSMTTNLTA